MTLAFALRLFWTISGAALTASPVGIVWLTAAPHYGRQCVYSDFRHGYVHRLCLPHEVECRYGNLSWVEPKQCEQ